MRNAGLCRISSICLCGMTWHPARGAFPERLRPVSNRGGNSGRSFSAAATSLDALPEVSARHHTHRGQAPPAPGRYRRAHRLSSRELGWIMGARPAARINLPRKRGSGPAQRAGSKGMSAANTAASGDALSPSDRLPPATSPLSRGG